MGAVGPPVFIGVKRRGGPEAPNGSKKGQDENSPPCNLRGRKKMNRNELAEELNVSPWEIDDWLLWGCPAEKFLSQWNFNLQAVARWLKENKIKIKEPAQSPPKEAEADNNWMTQRCPKCRKKGFLGEQAGLLCTYGEIVMGRWCFRRVGYPCGHSVEIFS